MRVGLAAIWSGSGEHLAGVEHFPGPSQADLNHNLAESLLRHVADSASNSLFVMCERVPGTCNRVSGLMRARCRTRSWVEGPPTLAEVRAAEHGPRAVASRRHPVLPIRRPFALVVRRWHRGYLGHSDPRRVARAQAAGSPRGQASVCLCWGEKSYALAESQVPRGQASVGSGRVATPLRVVRRLKRPQRRLGCPIPTVVHWGAGACLCVAGYRRGAFKHPSRQHSPPSG